MGKTGKQNIALVGAGYWGKNLLRNLYDLGVLHSVCEIDKSVVKERKKTFPEISYTNSYRNILVNKEIKAVVIATPASTHYERAKEAILAGKDVFVEKPLALKTEEAEELVNLARKKRCLLMVGHILQYHPAVIKLKELIKNGDLGKIQYIYSNRLNIGKLRTEENILWSFAPHDISVMLMLLEEEPLKVEAFGGRYITEGIFDTTLTTLEFRNGIRGHIFVSWLHPYKEQKLIVVGTKAMAVFDDVSKEKLFVYPHHIDYLNGKIPIARKAEHYNVQVEDKEPLKEELRHFVECIRKRKPPRTSGEEGLRVLKVLEKAEKALAGISSRDATIKTGNFPNPATKYFVHESSYVDDDVEIGEGTKIWHFSHILKGSRIGKNCKIGQNVVIGPNVKVGNGCKIQNNVSIYEGVQLEDNVFCGPSCVFTNVFNPRSHIPRMKELKTTRIKKGATIGANATIVCGNNLGRYSFVGAGSIVTKDVPDYALVYGNPAKIQGWMCECGVKLEFNQKNTAVCKSCGKRYRRNKNNKGIKII